ncbi:MAG: hypothetical protein DI629_07260 [Mesorhizobium amorphae]|nr:MAG: hypothetical protein DI629_07260 [Mesorhizobium amorphae]
MASKRYGPEALVGAIRAGEINLLGGGIDAPESNQEVRARQGQDWLVPGWLPAGTVTMFQSADERDARTLSLQLAMCFAAGQPFLGHKLPRGPNSALVLSTVAQPWQVKQSFAEIERGLRLKSKALKRMLFCPADGSDRVLARPAKAPWHLEPTAVYAELLELVEERQPGLIVLDSLPDLFGGDHFDHRHTTGFMALMERLCSVANATMLLLAPADFGAYR